MNLFLSSSEGLLERNIKSYLNIFTDIPSSLATGRRETATKKLRKYISNISRIKSTLKSTTKSTHSLSCSKSIIVRLFFRIRKNRICLIEFLKFCFFSFITSMTIWVKFHSFFLIRSFYLICTSRLGYSEERVIFF